MKYLAECQSGDIISLRGKVFQVLEIYSVTKKPFPPKELTVTVATLSQTDNWVVENLPRIYFTNTVIRLLGREA